MYIQNGVNHPKSQPVALIAIYAIVTLLLGSGLYLSARCSFIFSLIMINSSISCEEAAESDDDGDDVEPRTPLDIGVEINVYKDPISVEFYSESASTYIDVDNVLYSIQLHSGDSKNIILDRLIQPEFTQDNQFEILELNWRISKSKFDFSTVAQSHPELLMWMRSSSEVHQSPTNDGAPGRSKWQDGGGDHPM